MKSLQVTAFELLLQQMSRKDLSYIMSKAEKQLTLLNERRQKLLFEYANSLVPNLDCIAYYEGGFSSIWYRCRRNGDAYWTQIGMDGKLTLNSVSIHEITNEIHIKIVKFIRDKIDVL